MLEWSGLGKIKENNMTYSNELIRKMKKAYGTENKWTLCCLYGVKLSTEIMETELSSFNKGWQRYFKNIPYDNIMEKSKALKLYNSFVVTSDLRQEAIRLIREENKKFEKEVEEVVCL